MSVLPTQTSVSKRVFLPLGADSHLSVQTDFYKNGSDQLRPAAACPLVETPEPSVRCQGQVPSVFSSVPPDCWMLSHWFSSPPSGPCAPHRPQHLGSLSTHSALTSPACSSQLLLINYDIVGALTLTDAPTMVESPWPSACPPRSRATCLSTVLVFLWCSLRVQATASPAPHCCPLQPPRAIGAPQLACLGPRPEGPTPACHAPLHQPPARHPMLALPSHSLSLCCHTVRACFLGTSSGLWLIVNFGGWASGRAHPSVFEAASGLPGSPSVLTSRWEWVEFPMCQALA